jgi:DNA-directed RNA polymerase specialized sigma24 family protein
MACWGTQQKSGCRVVGVRAFGLTKVEGLPVSFEEWFGPQLPQLLRFAMVLCGSADLAQDLVQDVALKAQ